MANVKDTVSLRNFDGPSYHLKHLELAAHSHTYSGFVEIVSKTIQLHRGRGWILVSLPLERQCRRMTMRLHREESPPHSGKLNHALSLVGGSTQSQQSRPMSSGRHISMEHRPRRKHPQLNSDTFTSNETYLKEIQKRREETFF